MQPNIENVIGACNPGDGGYHDGHFDGCHDGDGDNEENLFARYTIFFVIVPIFLGSV